MRYETGKSATLIRQDLHGCSVTSTRTTGRIQTTDYCWRRLGDGGVAFGQGLCYQPMNRRQ